MNDHIDVGGLRVAHALYAFIENEVLPGSGQESASFWAGAGALIDEFSETNRELLSRREELQQAIDEYHRRRPGPVEDDYCGFLRTIGYLLDPPGPFVVSTSGVDEEVVSLSAPQLIVPLLNARFAINAANARWGSLYDALYGTDVIDDADGRGRRPAYNPIRGQAVAAWTRRFLDDHLPLMTGSHADVIAYSVDDQGLVATVDGLRDRLRDRSAFVGHQGDEPDTPSAVLLKHHGLHVELQIDREHHVGAADPAGVKDVVLEAAATTIVDLEDSVAAVDVEDKVLGYRNWLHLMQGQLSAEVTKGGRTFTRTLNPDRLYVGPDGSTIVLPGRSLLFVRQVGLLMTTHAVLDRHGREVPEGLLDALVCGLCSLHDLRAEARPRNSREGSVYVVKPKLHGPDEVRFTCDVFSRVEEVLHLPPHTIKLGIMDEERRTSANLLGCIAEAKERVVFINTGFLDRTADEVHTSMFAGPMVPKAAMRTQTWMFAYEANNVAAGIAVGLAGRGQIGKGMWAAPDNLADMLHEKMGHPLAGANCAWVPSPTAATLHAVHYHEVDVQQRQHELAERAPAPLTDLLTIPLMADIGMLRPDEVCGELDNNVQSILGYVVRWVNAGVGCSKVPDLSGTPLMEDRATCRISSQMVANWMLHGIVTIDQVESSLRRMAAVVDAQNESDRDYRPMAPAFDGHAFLAARALVIEGAAQPGGYTEAILHMRRRAIKETI